MIINLVKNLICEKYFFSYSYVSSSCSCIGFEDIFGRIFQQILKTARKVIVNSIKRLSSAVKKM